MATAGIGRQSCLCVILVKVGTSVATAVFEKRLKDLTPTNHNPSPWTVDEFLLANKPKLSSLNLSGRIWSKIFPSANLQIWDLALLCTILTECCDLQPDIRLDIDQLRKLRNKFFHMREPSIDDHKYQHYLMKLKVIFDRCLNKINNDVFTTEINQMFEDLKQGGTSQADVEAVMQKLKAMEKGTNERLDELKQNHQFMFTQFEELLHKVTGIVTHLNHSDKIQIPETEVEIYVRNCTTDKENEISNRLVQYFEECIEEETDFSDISTSRQQKIKEAIRRACKLFLSKGYIPVNAKDQCIFIRFQFTSLKSMIAFFREYMSGELQERLLDLQASIRMETGCEYATLEVIMDTEVILATLNEIVASVSEILQSRNTADSKGTLYNEKYTEARIRGVHLVQRTSDDSNEITNGLRVSFENYSDEHKQHLKESFNNGEIDSVMQTIQETVADEFKTTNIQITAHLINERTPIPQGRTDAKEEKQITHDTHTSRKRGISMRIIIVITALCCVVFMMNIGQTVHQDTATMELDQMCTRTQENPAALYMTDATELYRTQRKVANDLEELYLKCSIHPEKAKKVQRTVLSAQTQHSKVLDLMKKLTIATAHIQTTMEPLIDYNAKNIAAKKEIFVHIINIAKKMETVTRTTQLSYREIQSKTQKQLASKNKEFAEMKRIKETELEEKHRKEQKLAVSMPIANMLAEAAHPELFERKGHLESLVRWRGEGAAGAAGAVGAAGVFVAPNMAVAGFAAAGGGIAVSVASVLQSQTEDEIRQINKRKEQLTQATIDLENMERLKEVHVQLGNIDKHFTEVIKFWSDIATFIKALRDESTKSVFISQIVNPKLAKRFQSPIDRVRQRLKSMQDFSSAYVQESNKEVYTLYKFILAPTHRLEKEEKRG